MGYGGAADGVAILIGFGLAAAPAQASYVVSLVQEGANVVATGSGSIDLVAVTPTCRTLCFTNGTESNIWKRQYRGQYLAIRFCAKSFLRRLYWTNEFREWGRDFSQHRQRRHRCDRWQRLPRDPCIIAVRHAMTRQSWMNHPGNDSWGSRLSRTSRSYTSVSMEIVLITMRASCMNHAWRQSGGPKVSSRAAAVNLEFGSRPNHRGAHQESSPAPSSRAIPPRDRP
jgi:hypothetical protein